ncbi:MAG: NAD-dependent protein deacetylase [Woeseiaceae bacterium]|nr:NAD-dependent protein deacetylase [Woeseiaceae bacterium]
MVTECIRPAEQRLKRPGERYTVRMDEHGKTLASFLDEAGTVTVLTGAGVSTRSGIPGYRDENGDWKHAKPVQYADFVGSAAWRRRYWARSFVGWQRFSAAAPNNAHTALVALEERGHVDTLVTQNVDGLHSAAGSKKTIDLHGRLDAVRCLECETSVARRDWQGRLAETNPEWHGKVTSIKPDGDAELDPRDYDGFEVPACERCGGIMKPDVVFFGESVPGERVADAKDSVARSGGLLVVGSSLMVFSGLRFVRLAVELRKPVAIVNQGRTRGDDLATLKLGGDCGDVLEHALQSLPDAEDAAGL